MDSSQRRVVAGPGGGRYFAMLVEREGSDHPRRPGEPRRAELVFEDQVGHYVGSAPLFHRIPLWSVTDQEIAAMLQEALQRG